MNGMARYASAPAALAFLLSGCFTYVPAEVESVPVGREVRIRLSPSAMAALPAAVPKDDPTLTGELRWQQGDSLMIRVPVAHRSIGFHSAPMSQDVVISTEGILELSRREIDGIGTGLLLAGSVGAATAIILLIMDASGSPLPDLPDPPNQMRVPLSSPTPPPY